VLFERTASWGSLLYVCFDTFVGGCPPQPVRWVSITLGGKHAQWERHISVLSLAPRKRTKECSYLTPDGGAWYTVTDDCGNVLWDSRTVFPCYASLEECRQQHPRRHSYGPGAENDAAVARCNAVVDDLIQQGLLPPSWRQEN
jgi:hypothetical protein